MKCRALTILVAGLAACSTLQAGQKPKSIETWLASKHPQLSAVSDPSSIKKSKLNASAEPNKDGVFWMTTESGLIHFPDGTWVLLTSHSMHAEDGLADVSLIRTSTGEFYYNLGHNCDGLILCSKEKVASLDGFLKTNGKGAKAEATPWIPYVHKPTP